MAATPIAPHGPIWYGATVLVVDDDLSLRGIVRRMLEAEGFHVDEAPDGESALDSFKRAPSRSIGPD